MPNDDCENVYQKDFSKTLSTNINLALIKLQSGYDAAIVSFILIIAIIEISNFKKIRFQWTFPTNK